MRMLASLSLFLIPALAFTAPVKEGKPEQKKVAGPLELRLNLKKDTVTWDADGKGVKEYQAMMKELEAKMKKDPGSIRALPKQPAFEATVEIVNTGDKDITINVEGDANQLNLDLKGPGVVALSGLRAFTTDFRLPRAVTLKKGERFEIPITKLSDGFRRSSRDLYWTDVGEYTLTASYNLSDADGGKGPTLTSAPVKFKVELKK